jgi:hypothetical protein
MPVFAGQTVSVPPIFHLRRVGFAAGRRLTGRQSKGRVMIRKRTTRAGRVYYEVRVYDPATKKTVSERPRGSARE